jgi:hypothetical protein
MHVVDQRIETMDTSISQSKIIFVGSLKLLNYPANLAYLNDRAGANIDV